MITAILIFLPPELMSLRFMVGRKYFKEDKLNFEGSGH